LIKRIHIMKTTLIFLFFILTYASDTYTQPPFFYIESLKVDSLRAPFRKAGIPLITDLEKDGQKEIIFYVLDYNGGASPLGELYVINSLGNNYPEFPKGMSDYPLDIASGDVNGDGFLDIALRYTYNIDIIDRFGNSLTGFPIIYSDGTIDPPKSLSLYDLDNDGKLEIIVSKNGEICVFNFDGNIRTGWPRRIAGKAGYNPAIGDLDNDGFAEIITTSFRFVNQRVDSAYINVFRYDGSAYPGSWPIRIDSNYCSWSSSPSLYINKNFIDSSFILVVVDKVLDGSWSRHKFLKLNSNGIIVNDIYYEEHMDYGTLVLGDLEQNGNLESVTGTQTGVALSAFNNSLVRIPGWPKPGGGEHEATACIGKLSLGNKLNVINNTWLATEEGGFVYAYTSNGSSLPWSPLRPTGLVKSISLADLNNDGSIEIICTSTKTGRNTFLDIWTIPGIPYTKQNFPWPQYGHDRYRTNQYGFVPPDDPVGIQPSSTIVPDKFNLYQNFPNPFNPTTNIKFEIKSSSLVKLTIFDALGQTIETLVNEQLQPGTYQLAFDGGNYTSGVYFYRIVADDFVETKKMLLVK